MSSSAGGAGAGGAGATSQPVRLSLPLEYQQSIFHSLRANDELIILGRGLGLIRLAANLLHSYDAAGNNVVLVVGADDRENLWLGEALAEHAALGHVHAWRGLTVVNNDVASVAARERMYAAGGLFSVTSRILVVDLLTGLLRADTVTGIVVLHAERVAAGAATSLEAFILRIYRQRNRVGFLKALSDRPERFAAGAFAPLADALANLFLRRTSLWPRFQVEVARSLEGRRDGEGRNRGRGRAEVVELEVPLTDAMAEMQHAVLECIEASVRELKKTNPGLLDDDDADADQILAGAFDAAVRRRLDPHWHRLSWKTRQIVADLAELRTLLTALLSLDAVGLMQHLDTVHAAHAPAPGSTRATESPWLFLDAAQILFETARRRVYAAPRREAAAQAAKKAGAGSGVGAGAENRPQPDRDLDALQPVLEELPKWAVLAEILDEIDRAVRLESGGGGGTSRAPVLVMCSSTDTCRQIRDYLQTMFLQPAGAEAKRQKKKHKKRDKTTDAADLAGQDDEAGDKDEDEDDGHEPSGMFMMRRKLANYLNWKRQFVHVSASLFTENKRALGAAADPRRPSGSFSRGGARGAPPAKRRRVRGGAGGVGAAAAGRTDNGSIAQYFERPEQVAGLMASVGGERGVTVRPESDNIGAGAGSGAALPPPLDLLKDDNDDDYVGDSDQILLDMGDLVVIHAYDGDQDERVLEEVRPRYVVMYEPDPAFIRRIEVYRSSHRSGSADVRVYFMYYGGSVEEHRYLAAVRREKDAFTKIIQERASMAVTLTTETGPPTGSAPAAISAALAADPQDDPQEAFLRSVNTRIAGGGRLTTAATAGKSIKVVVVDVREFRSALPSLLHGRSLTVVPCMLTVGDYVLSPNMVVERKSIADLIASFRDGRLYHQCEGMLVHYRHVVLLIEFDRGKSFTLEPFADYKSGSGGGSGGGGGGGGGGNNPNAPDLHAKLVLLTLAFPRLRLVWSSSPHQTAEIFESLKTQEPEPDPAAAVRVGLEEEAAGTGGGGGQPPVWNLEPREMLAAVPGVTAQNMYRIAARAGSVRELANLEVDELRDLVGREDADKIWRFFNRSVVDR